MTTKTVAKRLKFFMRGKYESDADGKPEEWLAFDSQGKMKGIATDSNHDGKPDLFQHFLKGRDLTLLEEDRNYDGKMDRRMLRQWDASKRIQTFARNRPSWIPAPGYTWIWIEEDNDFDGKIDVYEERENEHPSKARIGQRMQTR